MPIWFKGVCDDLLSKMATWYKNYDLGEVAATKDWMDFTGEIKQVVTKRAHKIPLSIPELENLYRILKESPNSEIIADYILEVKDKVWKNGTLLKNGQRLMGLAFYKEQVAHIVTTLLNCRNAPKTKALEQAIQEANSGGKDLFEV